VENNEDIQIKDYHMDVEELMIYGQHITQLRRCYQQKAIDHVKTIATAELAAKVADKFGGSGEDD